MLEHFSTARLTARPIAENDLELLRQIHGDRRVMATLSVDACPHSLERSRRMLVEYCRHWRDNEFGLWMFEDCDRHAFAGYAGLLPSQVGPSSSIALAYAVPAQQWGRGYAVEMAQAVLQIAFDELRLAEVIVCTLPVNYGSRRVIQKLGFEYCGEIIHAGLPHVMFTLRELPRAAQSKTEFTTATR